MLDLKGALIGMIHLPPLPGAPRYGGSMSEVIDAALRDATALSEAGVDAVLIENFGDVPFAKGAVGPATVAALTVAADRVVEAIDLPLGINVLRNDGLAALAVAVAVGAAFVRVNVLAWARLTDQGIVEGDAAALHRARCGLIARDVRILGDVAVKHSAALAPIPLTEEATDLVERALADAVVVTGRATGFATDLDQVGAVIRAVPVPVLAGSGVTPETAPGVRGLGAGAIVGSSMMVEGRPGGPVDPDRARELVQAWRTG